MNKVLSIIIPVYNEQNTIHLILNAIKAVDLQNNIQKEIIIVDDCSTDDTKKSLARYQEQHADFPLQIYDDGTR